MTPDWLKQLREKAEAATLAPWGCDDHPAHDNVNDSEGDPVLYAVGLEEDKRFIAAANPAVVLWLLDMLDEAVEMARTNYDPGPDFVEDFEAGPPTGETEE